MNNFERRKQSCPFRYFNKCVDRDVEAGTLCRECNCPKLKTGIEQVNLLTSCVAKLSTEGVALLQALLYAVAPDAEDRAEWNKKARTVIDAELEKRNA